MCLLPSLFRFRFSDSDSLFRFFTLNFVTFNRKSVTLLCSDMAILHVTPQHSQANLHLGCKLRRGSTTTLIYVKLLRFTAVLNRLNGCFAKPKNKRGGNTDWGDNVDTTV